MLKKLKNSDVKLVVKQVNEKSDLSDFNAKDTTIMAQHLAFYPDYKYLTISDKSIIPEKNIHALYKEQDDLIILDYTNDPIYNLNKSCPISLNANTVNDYVRFFFSVVYGVHGRFIIVETLDDIQWQDEPPLNARKAISKLLMPLTMLGHSSEGFKLTVTYIFMDSLVKSNIEIDASGAITISDQEILIEDMPVMNEELGI